MESRCWIIQRGENSDGGEPHDTGCVSRLSHRPSCRTDRFRSGLGVGGTRPLDAEGVSSEHIPATDRGKILALWKAGGPGVKAAAEAALLGSDADVRQFLDHENAVSQLSDDRVATVQVFSAGGRAVREAAQAALDGTPAELDAFLKDGWQAPLIQDQRVNAVQILSAAWARPAAGGPGRPGRHARGRTALHRRRPVRRPGHRQSRPRRADPEHGRTGDQGGCSGCPGRRS